MEIYFCPRCGGTFDANSCIERGEFLLCPECVDFRVKVRGRFIVAVGILILFAAPLVPVAYVQAAGILIGGGLCVMGMVRSIRKRWLK